MALRHLITACPECRHPASAVEPLKPLDTEQAQQREAERTHAIAVEQAEKIREYAGVHQMPRPKKEDPAKGGDGA